MEAKESFDPVGIEGLGYRDIRRRHREVKR